MEKINSEMAGTKMGTNVNKAIKLSRASIEIDCLAFAEAKRLFQETSVWPNNKYGLNLK